MKFSYLYFTVHYCWHLESRLISLCSSVLCSGVHCCCCWVEGSSVFYFVHHSHKAHPAPLLHSSLCSLKLKYSVKQFSLNQLYVLCLDWEIFSSWLPPVLVTRSYRLSLAHFARQWPSRLFLVLFLGLVKCQNPVDIEPVSVCDVRKQTRLENTFCFHAGTVYHGNLKISPSLS